MEIKLLTEDFYELAKPFHTQDTGNPNVGSGICMSQLNVMLSISYLVDNKY